MAAPQTHSAQPTPSLALPATDDQILGLDSPAHSPASGDGQHNPAPADAPPAGDTEGEPVSEISPAANADAEPENLKAAFEANPELRRAWQAEREYREVFPTVEAAREIQKLFPTLEDARAASGQIAEIARLDNLFFSNHPAAHSELAAAVFRMDPQAFRSLSRAMAEIAAQIEPQGREATERTNRENAGAAGPGGPAAAQQPAVPPAAAGQAPANSGPSKTEAAVPAEHSPDAARANEFAAFYQEANAAAVEAVIEAIGAQVDRLLPEGAAAGARNRMVGEIYRELDSALRSNRALAHQVRNAFRSGSFDAEHERAIVALITGRARQALPGVAKKVIGEWTTGILAASQEKLARQRAAAARVDLTGAGAPGAIAPRTLKPGEIDYAKMTDADIMNL